jgi:molybdopterin molybdotransferase
MIAIEEAQRRVWSACQRLDPVGARLGDALGQVVAADIASGENVPPFDNTAVDGYAVQAADTTAAPVELDVAGTLSAGQAPNLVVKRGSAVRIMTGAPIPQGADAVAMVEDSEAFEDGRRVRLGRTVRAGDGVRRSGSDIPAGAVVLTAGTVLRPGHLGVLASIGCGELSVYPRARVGVLSTGDELVDDGSKLTPGQIRESNRTMLLGAVAEANAIAVDLGMARDDESAITAAVRRGVGSCDALLTSGGVSMGDFDLIKVVLDRLGDMQWMQIAIKPAKPFAFGLLKADDGRVVPVFGLPGNPVSSYVSFELLARPALRLMMGHTAIERPRVSAIADDGLPRHADGKVHFNRVHGAFGADGRWHVRITGPQGSHQLAASAAANGLAVLPDGDGVAPGGTVDVLVLAL